MSEFKSRYMRRRKVMLEAAGELNGEAVMLDYLDGHGQGSDSGQWNDDQFERWLLGVMRKASASEALLEGMTTEAKRHAARAEQLEAELAAIDGSSMLADGDIWQPLREAVATLGPVGSVLPVDVLDSMARGVAAWERNARSEALRTDAAEADNATLRLRVASRNLVLARTHAHHMFGADPGVLDRVGALHYLRSHGLPEATPADLDVACEGLETPWGSGPAPLADLDGEVFAGTMVNPDTGSVVDVWVASSPDDDEGF